ncbi:MAG: hypothetical protein IKV35_02705 [Clostridia bacterium]|nr:hypothetical protein [Clostridia bacterium]
MKKFLSILLCLSLMLTVAPFAFAAPAANAPVMDGKTLVTFGDSITALSTWPRSVAKATNMHLINSGIGGNTTEQARARFERDVLSKDPDFVIMSFATNDFYLEDGVNPRVTTARYKENLQYFIEQVNAIGGTPILMTPPFLSDESQGGSSLYPEKSVNKALDKYVVAMREVASATGTHLIDMHAVCDSGYDLKTFLIADGLHLADQGNQVYTDTIMSYLQNNFKQDASAPRVTTNDPPALESGAWTKSLISFDVDDWLVLFPGTLYGTENADGSLSFANTTGLWPELHYSPGFSKMFYAPVSGSYLTLDMELVASANISLYFDGPTPTHEYTNTSVALAPIIAEHYPSVKVSGYDISGGQDIRVTIPLSAIVPSKYIRADGTVLFSGVKMFVAGAKDTPVTFNELSVTTGGKPAVSGKDVTSLLPTALSQISNAEGKVEYVLEKEGALVMSRAAESDIAWPSIKVLCGKTVDLRETPYLHIKMNTSGGSGNGFLHYTDAHGNSGSVRLSALVDGTANDFATDIDVYVDLATLIGNGGTITLDYYTLSVYGAVGDRISWKALSFAKEADSSRPAGDTNGDGVVNTADAAKIFRHVLGIESMTGDAYAYADYNGDGIVSSSDVRKILTDLVNM